MRAVPAEAEVVLNGVAVDLGGEVPVAPGPTVVVVSAPGYRSHTEALTLRAGEERILDVTLEPVPASLRVTAGARGAGVVLQSEGSDQAHAQCLAPCVLTDLAPGEYGVKVEAKGYQCALAHVSLSPGEVAAINVPCTASTGSSGVVVSARGMTLLRGGRERSRLDLSEGTFVAQSGEVKVRVRLEKVGSEYTISLQVDPYGRLLIDETQYTKPVTFFKLSAGRHEIRLLDGVHGTKTGFNVTIPR